MGNGSARCGGVSYLKLNAFLDLIQHLRIMASRPDVQQIATGNQGRQTDDDAYRMVSAVVVQKTLHGRNRLHNGTACGVENIDRHERGLVRRVRLQIEVYVQRVIRLLS